MNIAYAGSTPIDSGGPAFKIVEILRQYSTPLPVEFVAKLTDLPPRQMGDLLSGLQAEGIVSIDGDNNVALTRQDKPVSKFFRWLTK